MRQREVRAGLLAQFTTRNGAYSVITHKEAKRSGKKITQKDNKNRVLNQLDGSRSTLSTTFAPLPLAM